MTLRAPWMPPGRDLAVFPGSEFATKTGLSLPVPASILTVPHSGTHSLVTCYERMGVTINRQGALQKDPAVVWLHWGEPWPAWMLDQPLVTTLRDPVLSMLSSHARDRHPDYQEHVSAWQAFDMNKARVDVWLPVDELPLKENVTPDRYGLKAKWLAGEDLNKDVPDLLNAWAAIEPLARSVFDFAGVAWPTP